jgi:hypothetical protein
MPLVQNDAYTSHAAAVTPSPRGSSPAGEAPFRAGLPAGLRSAAVLWFAASVALVGSGLFRRAPTLVLPVSVVGMTALSLGLLLGSREGRRWADALTLRSLALFQSWRLVPGVAFLVLYGQGALPWGFAGFAGIGDIAVALTVPIAVWAAPRASRAARAGYAAWSVAGFADLVNVVAHAVLLTRADPPSMHLMRELPLGLLPTFGVPLTFAAHALAFRRLRQTRT